MNVYVMYDVFNFKIVIYQCMYACMYEQLHISVAVEIPGVAFSSSTALGCLRDPFTTTGFLTYIHTYIRRVH